MFTFKKDINDLENILEKLEKNNFSKKKKKSFIERGNRILKRLRNTSLDLKIEELTLKLYIYENRMFLEQNTDIIYSHPKEDFYNILNDLVAKNIHRERSFFCFCI
jgi:hypothetical protein